jgi:replicative DNA helicase
MALCEESMRQLQSNVDVEDVGIGLKINTEEILINKSSDNLSHIFNGVEDVVSQVESILKSDNKILGVPTPFAELNKMTSGLVKGRLYILGARPSMGKSAIAMQLARTVSVNRNVVFASLEMGLSEYTERELFAMCDTNQDMISNGMVGDEIYGKLYKASESLADLKLYIIDNPECTLNSIENGIINCIAKNGSCDLVVVDYLQLMKSSNKKITKDYDIVTTNSKGLKILARKYNVPVLALCQLSRSLEMRVDKRPIMSDLRDSGSIEQDADVIMFIYRDEVYDPTPINRGKAELLIRKNRQGRIGSIPMTFQASKTQFKEASKY